MSKPEHIEDADIVIDLSGGRLAAQQYRDRIKQLQRELDKAKEENDGLRKQTGPCSCGNAINHDYCTVCLRDWET